MYQLTCTMHIHPYYILTVYKVVVTTTSEDSRKRQTSDPIEVFVEFSKASVDISGVLSSSSYSITVTAVNTYDENKTGEASVAISVPGEYTSIFRVLLSYIFLVSNSSVLKFIFPFL